MSASVSDMRDFIDVLERQMPWHLHPCTDDTIRDYLDEAHRHIDDPTGL